jgi:hypothetical protein
MAKIYRLAEVLTHLTPNGLELSCPAEAGNPSPLYVTPAGQASISFGPARRVSFSELLGCQRTADCFSNKAMRALGPMRSA